MKRIPALARVAIVAVALAITGLVARAHAAETYAHDAMGRLTDVTYQGSSSIHYTYDANGNLLSIVSSGSTTAVDPKAPQSFQFALGAVTPNPGSGDRSLGFSIAAAGHVRLSVTDVAGRAVATLYDRELTPGRYVASFSSARWATGVYFFQLESAGRSLHGRLIVAH